MKITDEMIDAGLAAYDEAPGLAGNAIEEAYRAMRATRPHRTKRDRVSRFTAITASGLAEFVPKEKYDALYKRCEKLETGAIALREGYDVMYERCERAEDAWRRCARVTIEICKYHGSPDSLLAEALDAIEPGDLEPPTE